MKHEKQSNFQKIIVDAKAVLCKFRFKKLLSVIFVIGVLAVNLHIWSSISVAAAELTIPDDYEVDYTELDNLDPSQEDKKSFEGIICENKDNKIFTISYNPENNVNGLVTLARISHTSSLKGYTFKIANGFTIELNVKYDERGNVITGGSFFGIGNDTYPFKGKIEVEGAADTPIKIIADTEDKKNWHFLFNNISNEAQIVSNGSYRLRSSEGSFVFCRKLTVTEAGEFNIRGFYFKPDVLEDGSPATVTTNGPTAVFAGEVVTGGASSFSVDLSSCFLSGLYGVKSNNDAAGGLIATVGAGVDATITLPASLQFNVTSGGTQKNAGILIGSNNGKVTFKATNTEDVLSFTGQLNATGSAGLIGANEKTDSDSEAVFNNKIIVDGLNATGLRAGGIAGTAKGPITVKSAEIKNSKFTKIDSTDVGRLGGAIGGVDKETGGLRVENGGTVVLSDNTFSASNSKDCYIGGYIGGLKTSGENINFLTISNTTITGSGSADKIGGCIGYLYTSGDFSVSFESDTTFIFNDITQGICGGVIGEVKSDLAKTVLIEGKTASGGTISGTINCKVTNGTSATVGGLVGKVTSGYLKTDNLSLNNSIVRANNAADLVGVIDNGAMLDVGNITINEANGSVLVGKTGQGSVVRLGGNITDNSSSVLNLVYEQDASLIYKDKDCNYVGNPSTNNDIGNYGQVVRNDTLKVNDTLQVLNFDTNTHKVSITSPLSGSGDINITGAADFAKLAVTFHTKGAISGVDGITTENYSSLFSKTINLNDDVSLVNTGIEQLTPSISTTPPFTGSFTGSLNGKNHTVTLAIGENILGNNEYFGVKASENNKRFYLGLFAALKSAKVNGVNIGGNISLGLPDANQYVGSLAGKADGTLSIQSCNVNTNITVSNGVTTKKNNTSLFVGGTVGYIGDVVSSLAVTNCTLEANITDSTTNPNYTPTNNKLYLGGLGGYVKYTGSSDIAFTKNTIKTNITKSSAYTDLKMGGFIGELVCSNYVKADLSGTTATDVNLNAPNATVSAGGILGYSFDKCHIILNGAYQGTVKTGSASLGGLLYTLNGRLTVGEGFSFLTGTDLTSTGELKGLLLADGKKALVTVKADPSGFENVNADSSFDLFVGENITEYTSVNVAAAGGIVTVETKDTLTVDKLPQSSDWYALINARPNTKTRYYFNIAGLENKTDASKTLNNAVDLLYWHVFDYAKSLPDYVKTEFFKTKVYNITSVTADIDMTDYCFYPTKKEAVTINFSGCKLTFGKPEHINAANQFFGLQAGLLSDITDGKAETEVNISNIKLGGKVSHLGNNQDGNVLGSGALICGTVKGSNVNNNRYDVKLNLSNITLSGLTVATDASGYRPMLINRIASYVDASVTGVKQENYTDKDVNSAASSLIGKGGMLEGSTPSSFVKMNFSNIVLDGKKGSTVFTRATLFDDVLYESGSGSFIYNFNFAEDWGEALEHQVTYGAELYLNEDQRTYFDKNIPVRPDSKPTESSSYYEFQKDYLPYVYYDSTLGKVNLLLSVNRKGADLIDGWGTYSDPYIIKSAKQLEYVSKLLSGNNEPFATAGR